MRRSRYVTGKVPKPKDRINRDIRESEVRLIDDTGQHVGVVTIEEALRRAEEAGLDLVEVSSASRPFVCRVMDYGNFKYEQAKKQREARKKQHTTDVKEIKLRPRISEHDYDFKMRHAKKFLLAGDKVKFIMMFRGRERSHSEFGFKLLERVATDFAKIANVENKAAAEGRNLIMVLGPDAAGVKAEKARLDKEKEHEKAALSPVVNEKLDDESLNDDLNEEFEGENDAES